MKDLGSVVQPCRVVDDSAVACSIRMSFSVLAFRNVRTARLQISVFSTMK
jgi:hypothetical protein